MAIESKLQLRDKSPYIKIILQIPCCSFGLLLDSYVLNICYAGGGVSHERSSTSTNFAFVTISGKASFLKTTLH